MEARAALLSKADDTDRFLAEALHRNVQGKITAIALLLRLDRRDEATREFITLTHGTLVTLEDRLGEWMNRQLLLGDQAAQADHELLVTGFQDWQLLESENRLLAERLQAAVQELSVNALRHGDATTMNVEFSRHGSLVTVVCADNGSGPPRDSTPGLGSALLDELCLDYQGSWSLERQTERTVVRIGVHVTADNSSLPQT
jgi:signal transduction histidine kinase